MAASRADRGRFRLRIPYFQEGKTCAVGRICSRSSMATSLEKLERCREAIIHFQGYLAVATSLDERRPSVEAGLKRCETRVQFAEQQKKHIAEQPKNSPTPSAVVPDNLISTGSCFWISSTGLAVTNQHVVNGAVDVTIWSAKSKLQYKAKVVAESLDDDLAVLQTINTTPSIPAALLVNSIAPRLGENVFTVGFPEIQLLGSDAKFTEGSISGLSGLKDSRRLQISVPVQHGNSGGALVNERGDAIGVIVSRTKDLTEFENVAFAINGATLQSFIRSFQIATASPTRNRTAAIARAESAACGVIVIGQLSQ